MPDADALGGQPIGLAPFVVGSLAQNNGFQAALSLTSVAFLLAAMMWIWIPETRGRALV